MPEATPSARSGHVDLLRGGEESRLVRLEPGEGFAEGKPRFAPGGSTVEHLSHDRCRLTLGAWSWAGIAGLLLTFDADIGDVEPVELCEALRAIRDRIDNSVENHGL